jgi:hypothetical protein
VCGEVVLVGACGLAVAAADEIPPNGLEKVIVEPVADVPKRDRVDAVKEVASTINDDGMVGSPRCSRAPTLRTAEQRSA